MDDSDWYSAEVYVRGTNLLAKFSKQSGNVKTDYQYYTQNAHGDVVNLTDSTGAITKSYKYDAFGVEQNVDDADDNAFRYCGEYFDAETGTIYLRARYYDPAIGRFISRDSVTGDNADPLSLNLYTYCHNNPVQFVDENGHWPKLSTVLTAVAVVAVAVAVVAVVVAAAPVAAAAITSVAATGAVTAGGTMAIGATAAVSAAASSSIVATATTVATYASATALTAGATAYGAKKIEDNIKFAKNKSRTNSEKKRSSNPIAKRKHYSSKKDAYEAAKRAGNGKEPTHHTNGSHGPHYHPNVPMPKNQTPKAPNPHDHYFYPKSK